METHVMLDLETLGTGSNSVILSIGAVKFNFQEGLLDLPTIYRDFYKVIDIQSCLDVGLEVEGSTIQWWLQQSEEARKEFSEKIDDGGQSDLRIILSKFANWYGTEQLPIWSHGSSFDNVILKNAYQKFKLQSPYQYKYERDTRTVIELAELFGIEQTKFEREGDHHNALDDAKYQVKWLVDLTQKIGGSLG